MRRTSDETALPPKAVVHGQTDSTSPIPSTASTYLPRYQPQKGSKMDSNPSRTGEGMEGSEVPGERTDQKPPRHGLS